MKPRIARVFPRRTKATPNDALSFTEAPGLFPPDVDAVHISVTFTWDRPHAEFLARQWEPIAPVTIGGPAIGTRGEAFEPGLYLKEGYTITSRGCPNHCWFCEVPKRDGDIRELEIRDGWNVLDDNLLACSEEHIRGVFAMLKRQKQPVEFTGGLEAARLRDWHVELLRDLRPKQIFFAFDEPDDWPPLVTAARRVFDAGWTPGAHRFRAYVLIGYPKDTIEQAEGRLHDTASIGLMPMAMLWRDAKGKVPSRDWRRLQRRWARPSITAAIAARGDA